MTPPNNEQESASTPRHVAIVMDGNGRWARERELPREQGHQHGRIKLHDVVRAFSERGVRFLTLYAFSTENWRRPSEEVQGLMTLAAEAIKQDAPRLHQEGARLLHLGRKDRLDPDIAAAIDRVVDVTKDNTGITLSVAFDYGGREEILEAARSLMRDGVAADNVDESAFESRLFTNGLPDPDLIIRTGGELRISNFLLWQAAYAELYFTPTLWPDFGPQEVTKALDSYAARKRRFGGVEGE
ncbi:MAG: polyprenyl diphosphate synthase [Chloroflexi bacterium]|nr:polyprenyl diphosphate synthase [Chloroflexota bacterium]